jgi:hypothetical protein
LADNETNNIGEYQMIVNEGLNLKKKESHEKGGQKYKTIAYIIKLNLITLVHENGEPELEKLYWNIYY